MILKWSNVSGICVIIRVIQNTNAGEWKKRKREKKKQKIILYKLISVAQTLKLLDIFSEVFELPTLVNLFFSLIHKMLASMPSCEKKSKKNEKSSNASFLHSSIFHKLLDNFVSFFAFHSLWANRRYNLIERKKEKQINEMMNEKTAMAE